MKTRISALCLAAVAALAPMTAQAVCVVSGEAVRAVQNATSALLYLRSTPLSTIVWFGGTVDTDLMNAAVTAAAGRQRVTMTSNATSCPTTGDLRSVGTITQIIINP
jgi:hypothetical protein